MSNIIIVCGGTGGHLTPGIALAEELLGRGHQCHLIISQKQVDTRLAIKYPTLNFHAFPGVLFSIKPQRLVGFIFELVKSVYQSRKLMKDSKADLIIGFGGFLTVGVALAGSVMRLPLVLHEANRHPGRTIRLLKNLAQRVYLPEGVDLGLLSRKKVKHLGYPVRKEIRNIDKNEALKALGFDIGQKLIFVLGGSQGARSLNNWVKENGEYFIEKGVNVYCITGDYEGSIQTITNPSSNAKLVFAPFSDQMHILLSAADLVISRAGAGSIAEIVQCCVPSVLIPFPFASDQHQLKNAKYLENKGGCSVVLESRLKKLKDLVETLIFSDCKLDTFKAGLASCKGRQDAKEIALDLEGILAKIK